MLFANGYCSASYPSAKVGRVSHAAATGGRKVIVGLRRAWVGMFIPQAYSPRWEPATIFGVRLGLALAHTLRHRGWAAAAKTAMLR